VPFLEVAIDLDGLDAEAVEEQLFAAGAAAVTYTDQRDDPILEPAPGEFRLWPASRLQALFDADRAPSALLEQLARELALPGSRMQCRAVADRVWEREWLRDFRPMQFGSRLWVCPTHDIVNEMGAIIVTLDPGLAFGTGTHPTTALCLQWLDRELRSGDTVIDYGCGSGILGIAAAKLGSVAVQAFDIDPQALTATAENAARNAVSARLSVVASAAALQAPVDLLLANILSGPLCELAPQLAGSVQPGGRLVLSGLLEHQVAEVVRAYAPWAALSVVGSDNDWQCLAGFRNRALVAPVVQNRAQRHPP